MSQPVGLLRTEMKSDTRCVIHWRVDEFLSHNVQKYTQFSGLFHFGFASWQLGVCLPAEYDSLDSRHLKEDRICVALYGPYSCKSTSVGQVFYKLSGTSSKNQILESNEGILTIYRGLRPKILTEFIRDTGRLLYTDGSIEVRCELRLIPEETPLLDGFGPDEETAFHPLGTDVLVQDFQKLLTSGDSSDATVRVKGERDFQMHRAILVARTPVFAAMFRHQMSESSTGTVNIADCEPDTFERFLQHIYTGRVEDLSPENATGLYQIADKYQVNELKSECMKCIKEGLSIASFCPTLRLALQYDEEELLQLATEFFANNIKKIIVTVEWQNFLIDNPIQANELFIMAHGAL